MPQLTAEQLAILNSIGKNTTVSAGAGAGKTGVMIERFVSIITRSQNHEIADSLHAGVGGILAFTFTDDAAAELKRRLVRRLTELDMPDQRREVETAYISTIHSFCQRLLRENPFEAGLDPEFTVLANGENALLLESAFEQVVDAGFRDSLPEVTGLFQAFSTARRYGDSSIDPVNMLREESRAVYDLLRSRGWRRSALEEWVARGAETIHTASLELIAQHLSGICSELASLADEIERFPLEVECALENARTEILARRQDLTPLAASAVALEARCKTLLEIRPFLGKTSVRKGADPGAAEATKERFRTMAALLDRNKKLLSDFDPEFEAVSAHQAWWLLALAVRLWSKHDELKRAGGQLDFNDLQSVARDLLLECPGVRERYQRRLRHVMVDEFQDTDQLQDQIVGLLRGDRNLFCVGDAKQSIYGFRNADVTIFTRLIQTMQGDPDRNTHLMLSHNFRCRPEIVSFVNHTFAALGVGDGIDYEHLVSGARFSDREEPSVEILLSPPKAAPAAEPASPAAENQEAFRADEADLVARRIRQIIDTKEIRITAAGDRQGEPVQLRDFMILLKTFTTLHSYERALEKHGVDYYIIGGRGYYALREIRDIANLLRIILNPLDDVALAAALRSPFCGLSDEALYQLAQWGRQPGQQHSLFDGVLFAVEGGGRLEAADQNRLASFWKIVEDMRRKQDRTPIATILEELLEATLYEARLLLDRGGRRKMANVRKLVVSASARNSCGVAEFLRSLEQLSRVQEREGEAPTEEEAANVVRIRTIHNAKGLEANVVILGALSQSLGPPFGRRPAFLYDLESGAGGCQYPSPESFKSRGSAVHSILAQRQERREADESLRLLYVAMTRAREHLALAGSFPCKAGSWTSQLLPRLGITGPPPENAVIEVAPGLRISVRSRAPAAARQSGASRTLLESVQLRMRSGEPVDAADLESLRRAMAASTTS